MATSITANGSLTTPQPSHAERVLRIRGGAPLRGTVTIGGGKNAALPALAATLLTADECVLSNVPDLADIGTMLALLRSLGAETEHDRQRQRVSVRAGQIMRTDAPADLVASMRASFLVAGPLLARLRRDVRLGAGRMPPWHAPGRRRRARLPSDGRGDQLPGGWPTHHGSCRRAARRAHLHGLPEPHRHGKSAHGRHPGQWPHDDRQRRLRAGDRPPGQHAQPHGRPHQRARLADDRRRWRRTVCTASRSRSCPTDWRRAPSPSPPSSPAARSRCKTCARRTCCPSRPSCARRARRSGPTATACSIRPGHGLRAVEMQTLPFPGFPTDLQAAFAVLMTQAGGLSKIQRAGLRRSPPLHRSTAGHGREHLGRADAADRRDRRRHARRDSLWHPRGDLWADLTEWALAALSRYPRRRRCRAGRVDRLGRDRSFRPCITWIADMRDSLASCNRSAPTSRSPRPRRGVDHRDMSQTVAARHTRDRAHAPAARLSRDEARWLATIASAARSPAAPDARSGGAESTSAGDDPRARLRQLDTISVVSRSHETVLWSRLGGLRSGAAWRRCRHRTVSSPSIGRTRRPSSRSRRSPTYRDAMDAYREKYEQHAWVRENPEVIAGVCQTRIRENGRSPRATSSGRTVHARRPGSGTAANRRGRRSIISGRAATSWSRAARAASSASTT